jgi:hypothetical protein
MVARVVTAKPTGLATGRQLALGLVLGPVVFTLAWLVLGFVSPGYTAWGAYVPYSPIHQGVSGLGLGPTGAFMNAAFLANGVLSLVGVVAAFSAIPSIGARARCVCASLLALPAIASLVDGVFTLESFMPHFAGFGLLLTVIAGFPVAGLALRRIPEWRGFGNGLIAAGPVTLVLAVLYFATFTPTIAGTQTGIAGITERLLIVEVQAWFVALGWRVFKTSSRS